MPKGLKHNIFPGDIEDQIVTTTQAAKILGVTPHFISRMAKDGWVEPVVRGRWNLVKLIHGRESQRKEAESLASKSAAAIRISDAKTREIELRIARHEGKFVPIAEFENLFDEIAGIFLTMLSGLPAQISRKTPERRRIEKIIDENRTRLADDFRKKAAKLMQHKSS